MTIKRLAIILSTTLIAMLGVVMLRAETTRLHYEISQLQRRNEACELELREKELELARLTSPMLIRKRIENQRLAEPPPLKKAAPSGKKPVTKPPRKP